MASQAPPSNGMIDGQQGAYFCLSSSAVGLVIDADDDADGGSGGATDMQAFYQGSQGGRVKCIRSSYT